MALAMFKHSDYTRNDDILSLITVEVGGGEEMESLRKQCWKIFKVLLINSCSGWLVTCAMFYTLTFLLDFFLICYRSILSQNTGIA